MAIGGQLTVGGESLHRVCFEAACVSFQVIEDRRFEDQKSAVDPALAYLRFLGEFGHDVAVEYEAAEASGRAHCGDGGYAAVRAMESEQLLQVYVAHTIAVSDHESVVFQPGFEPLDAASGVRFLARVHQVYNPVVALPAVRFDAASGKIESHAAVQAVIIEKVSFYIVASVTERDEEFFEAVMGVVLHDMPEDRMPAYFHHRLWFYFSLFREAAADAPGQDDNLHSDHLLIFKQI